ncbi:MAG TPA: T9SS type A sorting domain-containing protein [Bacteroidia bacterium]|nr:T9SS type A sorting domain-containing protein [Bacteroidia bacterium]
MIKKLLLLLAVVFGLSLNSFSQCNTNTTSPNTSATDCQCLTSTQTDCDLLPDITISWHAILNYQSGPNQNPATEKLNVTGATPNIGVGPLTVEGRYNGLYYYVCGPDTFSNSTNSYVCPDGSNPKQLIRQRVWHKNGSDMTYYDRPAGTMTYHTGHNHYHVDNWGVFTLRYQLAGEPNPLNWPIVATGAKLGFCLMDYYSCPSSSAANHCKDDNTVYNQGNNLNTSAQFPNYGLGGGSYSCGVSEQGISSGWEDVYDEGLSLMWINMPPNLCNGQYWIVMEVDPDDFFLESDENNNFTAVPYTITQWNASGTPVATVSLSRQSPVICQGENITLTANAGSSFLWSNGATTQSITVNVAGTYNVTVTTNCGTTASLPVNVEYAPSPLSTTGDTVCVSGSGTLLATTAGSGTITWKDSLGNVVGAGTSFTTPVLTSTTTYYATTSNNYVDTTHVGPMENTFGLGANHNTVQYLVFNALSPINLISVKVFANGAGNRTIELQDNTGAVIQTTTVNVPAGESRVNLNWSVPAGTGYRLAGTGASINLYRNNSALVSYPYTVNGVISITGSSAGATYYYFFYDWEVEAENQSCVFSEPAIFMVDACLSVGMNPDPSNAVSVYPNPASGQFDVTLSLPASSRVSIGVLDLMGRKVYESNPTEMISGSFKETISTSGIGKGVFMLRVTVDDKQYLRKLILN